jgi:hypothetical protein
MLAGLRATGEYPVLGIGPAGLNISENFDQYYSDDLLATLIEAGETRSHGESYGEGFASGTHNMYLDLSSSYGIPMLVIISIGLWRGMRAARTNEIISIRLVGTSMVIQGFGWQYSASAIGMTLLALVLACGATTRKVPSETN